MMKNIAAILLMATMATTTLHAQDELLKKASATKIDKKKKAYTFTNVIDLRAGIPVSNQGSSGTCWSYSANSFLESEMVKAGRPAVALSPIYHARMQYEDKAENYVRMGGNPAWGDGGEPHDVINMYAKYGAIPTASYDGLQYGATRNNFGEMQAVLGGALEGVVKNKNGTISPAYKKVVNSTLDSYLGAVPLSFKYNDKTYTPKSFADEVVGLNPNDYIEFMSQTNTPYWEKAMMMVPDNWSYEWVTNIPMQDITNIIDNALKEGYTVVWATDVSEPYFSWPNGVAYVPENALKLDTKRMKKEEKDSLFMKAMPELTITPEIRQAALDNQATQDDHGMQIVGMSKDQNGKEYYLVKNSWGEDNDYKGYLHVSKAYVLYKTTAIMLNKKGLPDYVRAKVKG